MSYSLWASVSLCGILVSYVAGMDFTSIGRCGDCWCLPEDGGTATCPTLTEGITDTFAPSDEIYTTFDLLNPGEEFLKLQSASGEACYPFAAQFVDEEAPYAEANAPECVLPLDLGDFTVCTYTYASSDSSCAGRRYIIDTLPNKELASNKTIVHAGGTCLTFVVSIGSLFVIIIKKLHHLSHALFFVSIIDNELRTRMWCV